MMWPSTPAAPWPDAAPGVVVCPLLPAPGVVAWLLLPDGILWEELWLPLLAPGVVLCATAHDADSNNTDVNNKFFRILILQNRVPRPRAAKSVVRGSVDVQV